MMIYSVILLGGLALAFSMILAFAAKKLRADRDKRVRPLIDTLPGIDCGSCGYAGCAAFAEALTVNQVKPEDCVNSDEETQHKAAVILGVAPSQGQHEVVMVCCSGGNRAVKKFDYVGIEDCRAALLVGGSGPNECLYGCLGMGSCVRTCRYNALSLRDGVATVDSDRCVGCKVCSKACPRDLVVSVPMSADVVVACSSLDKGERLRQICEIGCAGCSACQYACKYNAIKVSQNLAVIDYEKCVGCGDCAEKCPRKLIVDTKIGVRMM